MKLRSILGSLIGLASVLLFFTSCTKDMEDLKPDRDVAMLNGGDCSIATGMQLNLVTHNMGANPFFWRGDVGAKKALAKIPATAKQTFSGTDFSNQQFFVVTGTGGTLTHFPANGAIGVGDQYINNGETITLQLSSCMTGFNLRNLHLTFNGGNTAFVTICTYNGATLVDEIFAEGHDNPNTPGKGTVNFPVEYHAPHATAYFDRIVIKPTAGKVLWKAYYPNFNQALYYSATYFDLVAIP